MTKYNTESDFGTVDNITTLQLEDDAAYVRKGGNWHIPTVNEFEELYSNVNFIGIRDADNNIVGFKCVSRVNGNSFFLPTYSKKKKSGIINSWTLTTWYLGSYWLASLRSTPSCACTFVLVYSDSEVINGEYIIEDRFGAYASSPNLDEERCKPHCIRPVSD